MQTFCGLTTDGMLEYLAAIYKLTEIYDKVTTSALAAKMCVSQAASSSMLKRLQDSGFVDRSNTNGITLTEQGRLAAMQLIRRHRLLEVFLVEIMEYTWDQVNAEASRLEHAVSISFEDRMDHLCHYPTHCPHGDPIPDRDGTLPADSLLSVIQMRPGQQGTLRRVGTSDARVLRYLSQLTLTPGRSLRLVDMAPFNGPVTLELLNSTNGDGIINPRQILGCELAEQLYVFPQS